MLGRMFLRPPALLNISYFLSFLETHGTRGIINEADVVIVIEQLSKDEVILELVVRVLQNKLDGRATRVGFAVEFLKSSANGEDGHILDQRVIETLAQIKRTKAEAGDLRDGSGALGELLKGLDEHLA
jgi:hypothetical protein